MQALPGEAVQIEADDLDLDLTLTLDDEETL
jgi:hypothetical protein